jgi:hypothetical protein
MVIGTRRGKPAVLGGVMLVATCLVACGSAAGPGSSSSAARPGSSSSAEAGPTVTPRPIIPKSVSGSPGRGPQVISSPALLPGGKISSQKVVLTDRTLVINSVISRQETSQGSIRIALDLVVRNTSGKAIRNKAAFYQLIGPEGDTFGPINNSSDDFYGTIDAHASRSGTIEFEIPSAVTSSLYLLYRPEIATETVLTQLKIG